MLKRFLAVLCALLMIPVICAGAEEAAASYDEEERNLLIALSLITEDEAALAEAASYVTRGETARFLSRLSGNEASSTGQMPFTDVPASHKDYNYIYHTYVLGYMSGDGQGNFRPDDFITYEEAAAGFLRLLGYGEVSGDYAEGYIAMATKLGVFSGVSAGRGDNLTKADMLSVIKNVLDIDVMIQTSYTEETEFQILRDRTVLAENLHIGYGKGVISKNSIAGLTTKNGSAENTVEIDGVEYLTGATDAALLLGYRVEYYYSEPVLSGEEKELLYVSTSNLNETLVIDSDDILSLSGSVLKYTNEEDRTESITIANTADILYNGVPESFAEENIVINDGSITLIDNNRNGSYDVVWVEDYITLVVDKADSTKGIIYSKYDDVAADFSYKTHAVGTSVFFFDRKGIETDPSLLTEWDVISIKQDREGKNTYVYTTVTEVKGTVAEVNQGEPYEVNINGNWYRVAEHIRKAGEAELGDTYFYYLNKKGKIVAARELDSSDYYYAYINTGAVLGSLSSNYTLQVLEQDGNLVERAVANKLDIDEDTYKTVKEQEDACELLFGEVVKVKLNYSGEIREIKTTRGGTFSKIDLRSAVYIKESLVFGGQAALNKDTITFRVPNSGDTDKFTVTLGEKEYDDASAYGYSVYVAKDSIEADAILCKYNDSTPVNNSLPVYMVDSYNYVRNADGNYVVKLQCYFRSKPVNFELRDESVLNSVKPQGTRIPAVSGNIKLEKGDLIRLGTAYDGIVDRIEIYYDESENILYVPTSMSETPWTTSTDYVGTNRLTQGYIYSMDGDSFILAATNGDPSAAESAVQEIHSWKNTLVTVYDSVEDEVRAGSMHDAYSYEEVGSNATRAIVFTRTGEPNSILLYR